MKLQVITTEFFVNEKKKSVTCVITGALHITNMEIDIDFYVPKSNNCLDRSVWVEPDRIQNYNYFRIASTTKCKEGDTFDPIKGRKIAKQKARIRMYKEATKLCYEAYRVFVSELTNDMDRFIYMRDVETLDYEKNVLDIKLPENVKLADGNDIKEYKFYEEPDGVGYMKAISEDNWDVLYWEKTRKELLEQINNNENVKFEGKEC